MRRRCGLMPPMSEPPAGSRRHTPRRSARTAVHPQVVEVERRIAASPEIVFSFFTDPVRYREWQGVDAELDARPGGQFRVTMTGTSRQTACGVYLEVDSPRRLVYTWGWEENAELS